MSGTLRLLMAVGLIVGLVPLLSVGGVLANNALVSTCTEDGFNAALATAQLNGVGTITFACSETITFTSEKTITSNVTIIGNGNVIFDGGGTTRFFSVDEDAALDLRNLALNNGHSTDGAGAIENFGTLAIKASTFSGNSGYDGYGHGVIYNRGTLTITSSTFSDNSSIVGGVIAITSGTATITASTFSGNSATFRGGAININGGMLKITDSTFSDNTADDIGGAIAINTGTVEISGSTFSGNSAIQPYGGGGAIGSFATLAITNSTFSGNSGAEGGAIGNFNYGTLSIIASTLSNNSATYGGGAVANGFAGTLKTSDSIVAGNFAAYGPNCYNSTGTLTSLGFNLSDDTSCLFAATGDIQNSASVNLDALADNGGPTLTMLPSLGSDAIDNGACRTSADQRRYSRPSGSGCDIGAVEVQQNAAFPLCASRYTGGAVFIPLSGGCYAGQTELVVRGSLSFCINPYTGKVSYTFGRPCNPPQWTHTLPDDGDLLTCVSQYTGAVRWVLSLNQCSPYEMPLTIPALL